MPALSEDAGIKELTEDDEMKQTKKISLSLAILLLAIATVFSFLTGFAVSNSVSKAREAAQAAAGSDAGAGTSSKLDMLVKLIKQTSYYEIDEEELCKSIMSGFISVKGDRYAYYFDEEEFKTLTAENAGDTQGIGITVIQDTENNWIKVITVGKDSPAAEAGVRVGDRIISVGTGQDAVDVASLGYETAVKMLQGSAGTEASFTVARGEDFSERVDFKIVRSHVTTVSVMHRICATDSSVGIVRISNFDLTTPTQFRDAMDSLIASGCTYFVFDVRYNPGGDLASITAVLSLLLDKDDIVIRTKDRSGNEETTRVKTVNYGSSGDYSSCNIAEGDIGKYKKYVAGKSAVLCNGSSASAAELFTSALKDYSISKIVGTKTFGKGSMQTIINLGYYGYTGALKLTNKKYYPPISDCYDGIGIEPDVSVELSSSLLDRNIYDISDSEDNQLQKAVTALKQ